MKKSKTLKKGQTVTIYEDYIRQTIVEGKATLIKRIFKKDNFEYWIVNFHTHSIDGRWMDGRWLNNNS